MTAPRKLPWEQLFPTGTPSPAAQRRPWIERAPQGIEGLPTYRFCPVSTREPCVLAPFDRGVWPFEWRATGQRPRPWTLWINCSGDEPFFRVRLSSGSEDLPFLVVPCDCPRDVRRAIDAACYMLDGWAAREAP